jgi:hypothetical protein
MFRRRASTRTVERGKPSWLTATRTTSKPTGGRPSRAPSSRTWTGWSAGGKWSGDYVEGTSTFEWMEGGFFLLQHVDFERRDGQRIKGVEIIGHERPFGAEPGEEIKSRFYSNTGNTLDYVYELEGAPSRSGAGRRAHQRITGAPLPPTAIP